MDEDFGPFFIKFCSYLSLHRQTLHQRARVSRRAARRRGIEFEALDNGLLRCAAPAAAQRIAEAFDEKKIERFFRKWLSLLPHPYPAADRNAGFRYRHSVLQAEFSLTQIWDRPRHGREFFEEVIRENIDLGRPETVQLIFARNPRPRGRQGGVVQGGGYINQASIVLEYAPELADTESQLAGVVDVASGIRLSSVWRL